MLPNIERQPVHSSNIVSLGYHPDARQLEVEFTSGAIYRYSNVPAPLVEEMRQAPSIGAFFSAHIKAKPTIYPFLKMVESDQATASRIKQPHVTEVRYGFTFNRGDYQSERIDVVAMVEPGDEAADVLAELRAWVHIEGRSGR